MSRVSIATRFLEAVNRLGDAFMDGNVMDEIERITISFEHMAALYSFQNDMRFGVRDMYHAPLNEPGDWRRDENGFIYADWDLFGLPVRLTCKESSNGYPIIYGDLIPGRKDAVKTKFLTTVTIDPDTHMVVPR